MPLMSISLDTMIQRMNRGESYVVMDVRSATEFQNWQIKGQSLQAINVPYFDFKENEVNDRLIPEESHVVLISDVGPASSKVADRLLSKGYEVSVLDGGFTAWFDFYVQSLILANTKMKLIQVNRVATGCLSYAIVTGNQVIVVDPSRHIEQYLIIAEREHAKITHVIETHVHADHISGAKALLEKTSAEYYLAYSEVHENKLPMNLLRRGTMHVGSLDIRVVVVDTEGETRGNTLLVFGNECILSGDTIAVGEVAIPDLPGNAQEWADKLFNTVLREVKGLVDEVLVLPAHYADIQAINANGYVGALLGDIRLGAEAMARSKVLTFPHHPRGFISALHLISDDIKEVNVGLKSVDYITAQGMELDLRQ